MDNAEWLNHRIATLEFKNGTYEPIGPEYVMAR